MSDIAKKFLGYKAVVCGDTVEFYWYDKPFYADYKREYDIQRKEADEECEKRLDNLTRARRNVRQIVLSNITPHSKILTLTYAKTVLENKVFSKHFQEFCRKMARNGFKLNYLYVLERQLERGKKEGNAGCIHAHVIIFNDEIIPMDLLKSSWPHGRLEIHVLNGLRYTDAETGKTTGEKIRNAGAYLCKYITKEAQHEFNGHVFRCSKGLKRPVEHKFYTYSVDDGIKREYTTDDITGLHELRQMCSDNEYTYEQRIAYIDGEGKLCINKVHCVQVEVKPECRNQVQGFVKRFANGKPMNEVKENG